MYSSNFYRSYPVDCNLHVYIDTRFQTFQTNMAEELRLHRTWSSLFGLRVVWALHIKGIAYKTIFEDLSNKSLALHQYNPVHKKIPVLVHKGKPVCESLVILEYIDETWKELPLLPQDPYEKATARFWAKFGDEKLLPSIWSVFSAPGDEKEKALVPALENLILIEEQLKEKKFFGGEIIGYLDLVFGCLAYYLGVLEEVIGLRIVEAGKFPRLSVWVKNFSSASVIKEHWPPRDKLVTKFQAIHETYQRENSPK